MGQPENAARLTREGRTPSQLCVDLANNPKPLNIRSVLGYLARAIGEGQIRWSDVFFSIQNVIAQAQDVRLVDMDDSQIFMRLLEEHVVWGDVYSLLAELERTLHFRIRAALVQHLGDQDDNWWYEGVPERVRQTCTERRSVSDDRPLLSPYYYTMFPDLTRIINHQWPIFEHVLPTQAASSRADLNDSLNRAYAIRNRVMHPVRFDPPSQSELEFVRNLRDQLADTPWNLSGAQNALDQYFHDALIEDLDTTSYPQEA